MSNAALLLACIAAVGMAQQAQPPPPSDTLEEAVVNGEPERQRQPPLPRHEINPDVISVKRDGDMRMRLQPFGSTREVRFHRESAARTLPNALLRSARLDRDLLTARDGQLLRDVTLEIAPDIDEADGLPALIPFGRHTSLVNIDYVRLRDTGRGTLVNVNNALYPQTRLCVPALRLVDDTRYYPNRFILLGDSLGDCQSAEKKREGDLFFADGVPERLRQALREIYEPVYVRFARNLGSEPGITFVVWRPDSPNSDFRFERNWNRTNLLLFNGPAWKQGFDPQQQERLWEKFALEQIQRRLPDRSEAFTQSAVNYLMMLARSGRKHSTSRSLGQALPVWITGCARYLSDHPTPETSGPECRIAIAARCCSSCTTPSHARSRTARSRCTAPGVDCSMSPTVEVTQG